MWFNGLINFFVTLLFLTSNQPALVLAGVESITLKSNAPVLELAAPRAAVLSADGRSFLYVKNGEEIQPIASITKLMTALVFLENNPGWDQIYKIVAADQVTGGRLNLFPGEEVTIKDLFYTSLVASDNGATAALVHATGLSEVEFVKKMNLKARQLGLDKTKFVDPIGLSDDNVSTAREVAKLARVALDQTAISAATQQSDYQFTTATGKIKKIESTDYLLFDVAPSSWQVLGGKTGYTDRAGYCFVGRFKDVTGRELISVILNSAGKNERFRESKSLISWVLTSYNFSR